MNEGLNERSRQILEAIIEDYIHTGEPVGSRAITRRHDIGLSPASVRNVMADLEELGYLASPHTSAGRIPTEKGYRFYLNCLLQVRELSRQERLWIRQHYQRRGLQMEELLREAGRILSTTSSYTGIVMVPKLESSVFRRMEFISLAPRRIMVVFISQSGMVEHRLIETDMPITEGELQEAANYLNATFSGLGIQDIKQRIVIEMAREKALYDDLLRRAILLSSTVLEDDLGGQVFIEGTANILEQPEFSDINRMKRLLRAFEQKSLLVELLHQTQQVEGVQIFIGSPSEYSEIEGCSLVTASYTSRRGTVGTLGIIGPTRMPYAMVIPLVSYTASLVGSILDNEAE